jgi:hypothetical protein
MHNSNDLEICDLLNYYAKYSGNSSLTFRDNLSVPSSKGQEIQESVCSCLSLFITSCNNVANFGSGLCFEIVGLVGCYTE